MNINELIYTLCIKLTQIEDNYTVHTHALHIKINIKVINQLKTYMC